MGVRLRAKLDPYDARDGNGGDEQNHTTCARRCRLGFARDGLAPVRPCLALGLLDISMVGWSCSGQLSIAGSGMDGGGTLRFGRADICRAAVVAIQWVRKVPAR